MVTCPRQVLSDGIEEDSQDCSVDTFLHSIREQWKQMRGEESRNGGRQAHLFHFLWSVQHGPDDHHSVQKVKGDAVRRGDVFSAPARARMILSPQAL